MFPVYSVTYLPGSYILIAEFGVDTLPGAHNLPPEMWTEEY